MLNRVLNIFTATISDLLTESWARYYGRDAYPSPSPRDAWIGVSCLFTLGPLSCLSLNALLSFLWGTSLILQLWPCFRSSTKLPLDSSVRNYFCISLPPQRLIKSCLWQDSYFIFLLYILRVPGPGSKAILWSKAQEKEDKRKPCLTSCGHPPKMKPLAGAPGAFETVSSLFWKSGV